MAADCLALLQDDRKSDLTFFVNGVKVQDGQVDPEMTLLTYLRTKLGLCGTKLACGEGGCGACTVMVSMVDEATEEEEDPDGPTLRHVSVNACLAPVCSLHGMAVTTVEGIGSTVTKLHEVQQRLADAHGSQCGFCTPGMVMSVYTLLRNKPCPAWSDMEAYLQGNLCRCTGYRPILQGLTYFLDQQDPALPRPPPPDSCGCLKSNGGCPGSGCLVQVNSLQLQQDGSFRPAHPSQEPIFPPQLLLKPLHEESLVFRGPRMLWLRPVSLKELLSLKLKYPEAKLVVGNTELGVEIKFKKCHYPVMIHATKIAEMNAVSEDECGVTVGASLTLAQLQRLAKEILLRDDGPSSSQVFAEMDGMLKLFAGQQIRNVAGLAGNIITGSPISDLIPILMAAGCSVRLAELHAPSGRIHTEWVNLDENFFTGYRRNILRPSQVLLAVRIPFLKPGQHFVAFKQSRRREDDIAIVNAAYLFQLDPDGHHIVSSRIAMGGLGPFVRLAPKTCSFLDGRPWCSDTLDQAIRVVIQEFSLAPGVPGGMERYRQTLAASLLLKAYLTVTQRSGRCDSIPKRELSAVDVGAGDEHSCVMPSGHQVWQHGPEEWSPIGKPMKHQSADLQVSGEAVYLDDLRPAVNEAYLGFVLSSRAHAVLLKVDAAPALAVSGVIDFLSCKDLDTHRNRFHTVVVHDEVLFADGQVECVGQVIGVVVATDPDTARRAAALVEVEYSELPAILSIEEAIEHGSFHPIIGSCIKKGQAKAVLEAARRGDSMLKVVRGEARTGAQEHFYLECQATLAIPMNESGEMELVCSTQNPTETQLCVAHCLGVHMNKVRVRVKRIGGGFGGKETRSIPVAMAAAFAAQKCRRPVRVVLDRDEDMVMSGHRNPFLIKYQAAFTGDGLLVAVDVDIYNNAGYTADLSPSTVHKALFQIDNAYHVQHWEARGHCCKTNLQSNTAFRGFGGPQAMFACEVLLEHVAHELRLEVATVRQRNLYQEQGQSTHFNSPLTMCTLRRCWSECRSRSRFDQLQIEVAAFNEANRWKKRGVSMVPTKFGISFTARHLNQAGALVHIFRDGSVLLSHAGVEMGQGLHTKMIQVASAALGIPPDKVHVVHTDTDSVCNTSPTAASASSDLNGMAVLNACTELNQRLARYKQHYPEDTWESWVHMAYFDRVQLFATGFYATPDLSYIFDTNCGNPFSYYTFGAGCSLVEIDCLTGHHTVLSTDIVMDVGQSLNPAIDVGQIEGGFVQGYGMFIMEQLLHSPSGVLLTKGPGAYKIPAFGDIPKKFNVTLLPDSGNPKAVYSSKGVGEPPLFLASSVFFAIRHAIKAARSEVGLEQHYFSLDAPLTAERIRMACVDHITDQVPDLPDPAAFTPWAIQV